MKGMNDMLRQAQMMQKKMADMQGQLKTKTVEASSGGGMVTVVVTGDQELNSLKIDKAVLEANDIEMLEDLVLTAINDGIRRSKEMVEQEMSSLTGGLKIPGLF